MIDDWYCDFAIVSAYAAWCVLIVFLNLHFFWQCARAAFDQANEAVPIYRIYLELWAQPFNSAKTRDTGLGATVNAAIQRNRQRYNSYATRLVLFIAPAGMLVIWALSWLARSNWGFCK
jgi:hypothetical protein